MATRKTSRRTVIVPKDIQRTTHDKLPAAQQVTFIPPNVYFGKMVVLEKPEPISKKKPRGKRRS